MWRRVHYSHVSGKITTVICLFFGLVTVCFGYSFLVGVWTTCVGCLIGLWELPDLFFFVSQGPSVSEFMMQNFRLENKLNRGVFYFFVSLFCFTDQTPCIVAGLLLLASAALNGFAHINETSDSIDGTVNIGQGFSGYSAPLGTNSEKTGLVSSKDFGTF
jgi:hypothetical protein